MPMLSQADIMSLANSAAKAARDIERERCVAEVRRIQKRNTATDDGKPNTWNRAVETMAAECIDAING